MQYQRRIIIVGKSGNGKSSTANSILQQEVFVHKISANAVTKTCSMKISTNHTENKQYNVVDTPGILDTGKSVSEKALEIQRSVDICPEPHAFLIVFSAQNRMTEDERFTIDVLRVMFGECIFSHSIVVFTHGNSFESDLAFQRFWKENEMLVKLIELCGNRVVRIENTDAFPADNKGTQNIFETIESMSDAGETVYRYTGLHTHRSVIKEHFETYNGTGGLHEEISELVKKIGEKMDNKVWNRMLYGGVLIGTTAALGVAYMACTGQAVKPEEASALGSAVLKTTTDAGQEAAYRTVVEHLAHLPFLALNPFGFLLHAMMFLSGRP